MPKYVLILDAHAMDHLPDEDMPEIDNDWKTRGQPSWRATGPPPRA